MLSKYKYKFKYRWFQPRFSKKIVSHQNKPGDSISSLQYNYRINDQKFAHFSAKDKKIDVMIINSLQCYKQRDKRVLNHRLRVYRSL